MEIAKVVVDVPTMQTNVPYSYEVPFKLHNQVKPGMRVVVPFGRGNRKVSGFVLSVLTDQHPDFQVKKISRVMDLEPVLTPELLQLSQYLAASTYSFQISCLQTMLPALLKAKYNTLVKANAEITDSDLKEKLPVDQLVPLDNNHFTQGELAKLTRLKKQGKIDVIYQVKNEAKPKTNLGIKNKIINFNEIAPQIKKNATGQQKLLKALKKHSDEPLLQKQLVNEDKVPSSAIRQFEKNGWVEKVNIKDKRNPYQQAIKHDKAKVLTADQEKAVRKIDQAVEKHENKTFLLEGVTGSGKTEVYLQTIQKALDDGQSALMLVPEIALTPQMVSRVKNRFGESVAVLHSGLSSGEKFDEWTRIKTGKARVVVGARSAIFAPLTNLGIIILDEEHDLSYKQNDNPRYQTREVAKWRGKYNNCPVVLGSATPSLESRARASKNVYELLTLPNRINQQQLPDVSVVDMTKETESHDGIFSQKLLSAIKNKIKKNEQVVLLLNRRGFSSFLMCRDCGYVLKCPNCDISLTLHMDSHTMKCHYCGHEEPIPKKCPRCGSHNIRYFGTGTEKVEKELSELIPEAKILRMDVDTTRRKGSMERILQKFGGHKANVLLGTQMIAKGLDFPDVTLVGVLNADTGIDLPDFRAGERTFDLLTQVSGRAGRSEKPGSVIIQTFNPDNYVIQLAQQQDYEAFYQKEMEMRHLAAYSPYYFVVKLTISSKNEHEAASFAYSINSYLKGQLGSNSIILGPSKSPVARVKQRYYYQIIIKYKKDKNLRKALDTILMRSQKLGKQGLQVAIDSDPVNFM